MRLHESRRKRYSRKMNQWVSMLLIMVMIVGMFSGTNLVLAKETGSENIGLECSFCGHEHDDSCYEDENNLICGKADYTIHTHDENCYDAEGNLICELPEVKEHEHSKDCYSEEQILVCEEEHEHSDKCYENELICTEEEVIAHEHTEECYDKEDNLICDKIVVLKHQHTEECKAEVVEETVTEKDEKAAKAARATIEAEEEPIEADVAAVAEMEDDKVDFSTLTPEEIMKRLNEFDPEELMAYIEGLDDEAYEAFTEALTDEQLMQLQAFLGGETQVETLANNYITQEYVGYRKLDYSLTNTEFAVGRDGHGVNKYYLVTKEAYDHFKELPSGSAQNEMINDYSEVAYCFNYYSAYPEGTFDKSDTAKYYEAQHSTADYFYYSTSGYARTTSATELYNRVLGIAMNGYPNNASGIKSKYGLNDDQLRYLTQYAIWYWTDQITLSFRLAANGKDRLYEVFDNGKGDGKKLAGPYTDFTTTKYPGGVMKAAYEELINSYYNGSNSISYINIYRNIEGGYQNLLTVGWENPYQSKTGMKIQKVVTGEGGELNREFTFKIQLKDQSKRPLSGTFTVRPSGNGVAAPSINSITFNSDGIAYVKLKHGQSIQIDGLPLGYFYTVRELEADTEQKNYRTTVTNNSYPGDDLIQNSNMHKYEGAKQNQELIFTNHRIKEVPDKKVSVALSAKKTLDGTAPGAENIFEFELIDDKTGKVLQTVKSDADGNVRFAPLTYDQAGTYTYTVKEVDGKKAGIIYDKTPRKVTVTINESDMGLTHGLIYYATEDWSSRFLMKNSESPTEPEFRVFCLNRGSKAPNSFRSEIFRYNRQRIPSLSDLENYVDNNRYGEQLIDVLKKVTYYNEYLATNVTEMDKNSLIWCASGHANYSSYQNKVNEIIKTVQVPENYNLELYIPENGNNQAFIRGCYIQTSYTSTIPEFKNKTGVTPKNNLELSKEVTGNAGETDREFNFTITLMNENFSGISGTFPVVSSAIAGVTAPTYTQLQFNAAGQATVKLKHGQKISINDLPDGFKYQIVETEHNKEGYTTTYPQDGNANYGGVTGTANVVCRNERNRDMSLTLKKTVTGTGGDTNKLFNFKVYLFDKNGSPLKARYKVASSAIEGVEKPTYTELDFSKGYADVQLKHGQSIKIEDLPGDGYRYNIEEAEANKDGYTTTTASLQAPANGRFSIATEAKTVEFINHKDDTEYSLKVTKNNEGGKTLQGAGFALYKNSECTQLADVYIDEAKTTSINNAAAEQLWTDKNGVLHFYGLKEGTYYLKETRTPSGYSILVDPVVIVVDNKGKVTVNGQDKTPANNSTEITLTVTDSKVQLEMPSSGMGGNMPFVVTAMIGMMLAFGGFVIFRRKRV